MARTLQAAAGAALMILMAGGSASPAWAQNDSPTGRWKTYDDKTGDLESIVEVKEVNGEVQGYVAKVFAPPSPNENPLCDMCTGERKDKPVVGMQIMWGMKKKGAEFSGGRLFDPGDGKEYRGKIRLVDGGRKLEVRGFIGFSMFGRTQTWVRE